MYNVAYSFILIIIWNHLFWRSAIMSIVLAHYYLFIYFGQFAPIYMDASFLRTAYFLWLFFFFWCRQPSWHILLNIDTLISLHCCRFVWLYISEANLQSRFRSGTVDLCFWLLIVEDGQLTFCHEPLLHQRGIFARRPAAHWMFSLSSDLCMRWTDVKVS